MSAPSGLGSGDDRDRARVAFGFWLLASIKRIFLFWLLPAPSVFSIMMDLLTCALLLAAFWLLATINRIFLFNDMHLFVLARVDHCNDRLMLCEEELTKWSSDTINTSRHASTRILLRRQRAFI
jgi:hypothetical protein